VNNFFSKFLEFLGRCHLNKSAVLSESVKTNLSTIAMATASQCRAGAPVLGLRHPRKYTRKKTRLLRRVFLLLTAGLPMMLSSCSTDSSLHTYHNTDSTALIVQSLDGHSCRVLSPTAMEREENIRLLERAKTFSQHQTAVVILENYDEARLGPEFRDRSLGWFISLRGLGYQHIYFLKGGGVADPNGLPMLAQYD
jgi:hypothetical protein